MSVDNKKAVGVVAIAVTVLIAFSTWAWGLRISDINRLDARDQDQEVRLRSVEQIVPVVNDLSKSEDRLEKKVDKILSILAERQ